MTNILDLKKIVLEKNIFLFEYKVLSPQVKEGMKSFIIEANNNFKKLGAPIQFDFFFDECFDSNNNVEKIKIYLTIKNDTGFFLKFDEELVRSMTFELLFHVLGAFSMKGKNE